MHRVLRAARSRSRSPELVDELNAFQPQLLNAYPSIAALLADEQLAGRLRLRLERHRRPAASCARPSVTRRGIEEAFGVRPVRLLRDHRGPVRARNATDHAGMHLFEDMCIVENVDDDGQPVPAGRGRRAPARDQPLQPHAAADPLRGHRRWSPLDPEPCPCGRSLTARALARGPQPRTSTPARRRRPCTRSSSRVVDRATADVREFQVVQQGDAAAPARRRCATRRRRAGAAAGPPRGSARGAGGAATGRRGGDRGGARALPAASSRWSLQTALSPTSAGRESRRGR